MLTKKHLNEVKAAMEASLNEQGMQSFLERSQTIQSIEKMPGDASTRRYYRVKSLTNGKITSLVVMAMEPYEELGGNIPFLAIQRHLKQAGVDVPTVLDFDPKNGYILLEDLGDVTLLRRLQNVSSAQQERDYFQKAIDGLVTLHTQSGPRHHKIGAPPIEGFHLRFDYEKLMWEVNFTIEHFYQKHLGRTFSDQDAKIITSGFGKICTELESEPTVFTHRDYHSRNVMVTDEDRFVMIDFQDARMGPCHYDLASLLRDSYYQLEEKQIETLVDYYFERMKEQKAAVGERPHFNRLFDLMAVQRNFKAIGSFASFLNRRGNPAYLKFIGNTFENIRRNLMKYPEFKNLREVLYHYYYF